MELMTQQPEQTRHEFNVHGLAVEVRAVAGHQLTMWRVALMLDGAPITIGYVWRKLQTLAPTQVWSWIPGEHVPEIPPGDKMCSFVLSELVTVITNRYLAEFWRNNYRRVKK